MDLVGTSIWKKRFRKESKFFREEIISEENNLGRTQWFFEEGLRKLLQKDKIYEGHSRKEIYCGKEMI